MGGASGSYDSESYQVPDGLKIKDEPEEDDESLSGEESSLLSPSGVSPIDMESQERIKLERKRLRNRLAASKCASGSWNGFRSWTTAWRSLRTRTPTWRPW